MSDKWETRSLVREGAPDGQTATFTQKKTSGHEPQLGLDTKTDRQTDWPSVASWLWLWLFWLCCDVTYEWVLSVRPAKPRVSMWEIPQVLPLNWWQVSVLHDNLVYCSNFRSRFLIKILSVDMIFHLLIQTCVIEIQSYRNFSSGKHLAGSFVLEILISRETLLRAIEIMLNSDIACFIMGFILFPKDRWFSRYFPIWIQLRNRSYVYSLYQVS
jgi:hypothetical protein